MTKQNMIDAIYDTIADKELSFGCRIVQHPHIKKISIYLWYDIDEDSAMWREFHYVFEKWNEIPYGTSPHEYDDLLDSNWNDKIHKIIWHPVLIWDVLDYLNLIDYWLWYVRWTDTDEEATNKILLMRKSIRKPIQYQSEHCVKYIYDLIQTIK